MALRSSTASSDLSFNSFAGLLDLGLIDGFAFVDGLTCLCDLSFNSFAGLIDLSLIDGLVSQ